MIREDKGKGMSRKQYSGIRYMAGLLAAVLALTAFSAAAAEGQVKKLPIDLSGGAPYKPAYNEHKEYYEDPTIRVDYHRMNHIEDGERNEYNITYFYAFVTIADASQLRTASADPKGFNGRNRAPAQKIARRVNAVLALDGDFHNNFTRDEGSKYCLRQGTVYRDTVVDFLDMLLIDEDGDFHVYPAGPELKTLNKEEINGKKIINAFQFGPALVIDGEPVADECVLDPAHAPWSSEPDIKNPRMCIAQIDRLHYFVLTCWHGVNLAQLRDLVLSITPCRTLYVLDGGNSGQLVFQMVQVNLQEGINDRTITDIIYFASADQAGR